MTSYKIIKDDGESICLGKDNGSLLRVDRKYFDFLPEVGETVEVYENNNDYIILKSDFQKTTYHYNDNNNSDSTFEVLGWISIVLSLFFLPIIFGTIGVIMGYIVRKQRNETRGTIMMITAIAVTIIGVLIGAIIGSLILTSWSWLV